jgi:hypothetical protein
VRSIVLVALSASVNPPSPLPSALSIGQIAAATQLTGTSGHRFSEVRYNEEENKENRSTSRPTELRKQ